MRLWEGARAHILAKWVAEHRKEWDATHGGGAEAAAWEVLLMMEGAEPTTHTAEEHTAVALIVDMVKAFETVSLEMVWYWAKKYEFPHAAVGAGAQHVLFQESGEA